MSGNRFTAAAGSESGAQRAGTGTRVQAGSAIFGWCVLSGALLWILATCRRKPDVLALLIVAWAFRAGLALFHHYVAPLPDSQFDALNFQDWALFGSMDGLSGAVEHFTTGAYMYPSLVSFLFLVTGPNELVMQSLNVALGVAIVYLTYDTARLLFSHREGMFAGWIAALWPSLALYASITMREVFVVVFLLLACRQLVYWRSRRRITDAILAGGFALCSMLFHTGMAMLVLGVGLILSLTFMKWFIRIPRSLLILKFAPLVLVGVAGLVVILRTGAGLEKFGGSAASITIEMLAEQQSARTKSRAQYLDGYFLSSWTDLVMQAPLRMAYFQYSPFPWQIRAGIDIVGAVDGLFYMALTLAILLHARRAGLQHAGPLLFLFLFITYGFSFVTSNSGTAFRHRAKLAPIAIILAAPVGLRVLDRSRRVVRLQIKSQPAPLTT